MPEKLLIWWLAQQDHERIKETGLFKCLPKYIQAEYHSRCGRNGRGRLWIPKEIQLESIEWDDTKPLASIAKNAGGIVIKEEDAKYVAGLPGFISDTVLNLWVPSIM